MIYEFQATQDLHGYSEPWPAGGSKNKLPPPVDKTETHGGVTVTVKNGVYTIKGTITAAANFDLPTAEPFTIFSGNPKPKLAFNNSASISLAFSFRFMNETTLVEAWTLQPANRVTEYSAMQGADCTGYRIEITSNAIGNTIDFTFAPIIVENDVTNTSFAPFANICPPEGFNIWDPDNDEFIQVYAGYVNSNTRELYLRPVYQEYAGEELVGPWMSSLDPYEEDTTPTEGAFVIDFGGELTSLEITPFMLQTLLDSLGIRQHFTDGAGLLNKLMDQAQGRVRSEEELLHLSRPLKVIAIGDQLPAGLTFKPISKDVLPGLPGKFIR